MSTRFYRPPGIADTSPQLRRRGLTSILLRDAHRWFNAQDVTHVRAVIWYEDHASLTLFQDIGYEIDE